MPEVTGAERDADQLWGRSSRKRLTSTSPQDKNGRCAPLPQTRGEPTHLNLSPCARRCETSETLQLETKTWRVRAMNQSHLETGASGSVYAFLCSQC